jgi:hypothetical protein
MVAPYEELRGHVVQGRVRGVRHGMTVLLQGGMAAWMRACLSCPPLAASTTPSRSAGSERRMPDEQLPALVDLLANLALDRLMEFHV